MAYVFPTVEEFKIKYPQFEGVDDAVVQTALDEAAIFVTTKWPESVYAHAAMLYTAHVLVSQGYGTGAEAEVAQAGLAAFSSIRSGSLSFSRAVKNQGSSDGAPGIDADLSSTTYGVRYLSLVRRYFSGPVVV